MNKKNDDNFVRVIDNLDINLGCDDVMFMFEKANELNLTYLRPDPSFKKEDTSLSIESCLIEGLPITKNTMTLIDEMNSCLREYTEDYHVGSIDTMQDAETELLQEGVKVQKTKPMEGYHVWHCENSYLRSQRRYISYILYLNDIEEGGETEFLYLQKRIQPKKGRLLIFPAGWTHTHRGNPPLNKDKYIITGWISYCAK